MEQFVVKSDSSGMRLDRFLRTHIKGLQQSIIQKWARKGLLRVNGKRNQPDYRVQKDDQISCPSLKFQTEVPQESPKREVPFNLLNDFRSWIIYEDEELLAINKPAGLAVQGGTNLKLHLGMILDELKSRDNEELRLVHRIDRETSGILLLAKTRIAADKFTKMFKERDISKMYLALVVGQPQKDSGVITLALSKVMTPHGERVVTDSEDAREAITHYKVMTKGSELSLLLLEPKTGRTHQLRAHCAYGLGTPILGDAKYGGKGALPFGRESNMFLHAFSIKFSKENSEDIEIKAELPSHFFKYIKDSDITL